MEQLNIRGYEKLAVAYYFTVNALFIKIYELNY